MSSTFYPIAIRRLSRSGWATIPELNSSVVIGYYLHPSGRPISAKDQRVTDCWHLLKNLREAIERLIERRPDGATLNELGLPPIAQ